MLLSLAIVWTQFLSCCIDHRQGVVEGGLILGVGGGGVGVLDGYGGKVSTHCILSLRVHRKAGGPWRVLQTERGWVGSCPCSSVFSSQPCSRAR